MKNTFVVLLILAANVCSAQLTFGEHVISDNTILPEGVTHVELADIDGDGDQDMLTASVDDNKIAWFENMDGLGNFGSQNVISLEVEDARYVRSADLDGDGDMDVIGLARFDDKLMSFMNDGNGNFTSNVLLSFNSQELVSPVNVMARDIDGDAKIDLILLSQFDELIFYNNIDNEGNYTKSIIAETKFVFAGDFDVSDIDNDGDLDVVSHGESIWSLSWHEFENGSFTTHDIDIDIAVNGLFDHLELADIDSYNYMDLVIATSSWQGKELSWIEFNGQFSNQHLLTEEIEVSALEIADVNQDGNQDIIVSSPTLPDIAWLENLTDGLATVNYIPNSNTFTTALLASDINGDSYPDLITADIRWYTFLPTINEFSSSDRLNSFTDGAYDVVSMDIDEDGDLDIISASNNDGRIGWFENVDGLGNYNESQILITDDVHGVSDIHLSDIDGDDDLDIVGTVFWDKKVFWIRNDGASIFSDAIIIENNLAGANSVDVGDIDGDGNLDLIVASYGDGFGSEVIDNAITWYRNEDGLGGFSSSLTILENDNRPSEVKLADIDMDQDLDVVCTLGDGGVKWIENLDGAGNFGLSNNVSGDNIRLSRLEVGDMDQDGDVDIICSSYNDSPTVLYINEDGQGNFSDFITVSELASTSLSMSDLDQDGDIDIVATTASSFAMDVAWYEQSDDDFNFTTHVISESPVRDGNNVGVADLDNDGDLDVISASISDDKIAWYENYDPVFIHDEVPFQFSISPVPAATSLLINSEVTLKQITIYNVEGRVQIISNDVTQVDVSSIPSGLYIVQVENVEGNRSAMKFIKK